MSSSLQFGTSGWRAVLAEDFTFENVRVVARAIARFVRRRAERPRLIVGYDTRFLAETFARESARILAEEDAEATLQAMLRLVEPAMLVVIGGVVAWIAASVYVPLSKLGSVISGR